jgi:hypothetical protein
MFTKKEGSIALQLTVSLIKEKYGIESGSVKGKLTNDPEKVSIVLLNGQSGADTTEVDKCNKRPIEFLKAHNAEVTKEAHEHHSYWSYSVITLNTKDLEAIIDGLNVLPTSDSKPDYRMMARC